MNLFSKDLLCSFRNFAETFSVFRFVDIYLYVMLRLLGIVSFLLLLLLKKLVLPHANRLSDLEQFYYLDNSVVGSMRNDEDFYHFLNRLTNGMSFNISMFNHKLLKVSLSIVIVLHFVQVKRTHKKSLHWQKLSQAETDQAKF